MTAAFPFPAATGESSAWRSHLAALAFAAAAILALHSREVGELAYVWWNDATFNHCLLVLPIVFWLVWQRRPELASLRPAGWAPGLVIVAAGALAWLLGEVAGVALGRHAGLVIMLQGAVAACLGKTVARALLFPLAYAFFLVPFGEQLVPPMQTLTAEMAMALLGLGGVPAHLEGVFITTPRNYYEVAEACAGLRFVIAMLAFGALAANLCFRAWRRRIVFMIVCILVPVLANGVRAWGTILIAEQAGVEFAAGFDHVLYGGIFFGLVMTLILAAAWRFFDRAPDEPWLGAPPPPQRRERPAPAMALAAAALAALPLAWSAALAASASAPLPRAIELPQVPGWHKVAEPSGWRPNFAGADLFRQQLYRDSQGREVDLVVAVYADPADGREPLAYGQGSADGWGWTADSPPPPGGRAERIASHGLAREVASFYRVGDVLSGSALTVKLETLKLRLIGGPRSQVAVLVSAPAPAAGASPRPAIDDFLAALGPVERLADRAAGRE